jgi:hypothetical protein
MNRVELKPDNHLPHHNAYTDLEIIQWKPNGHQVEDKKFKDWEKVESGPKGHPQDHNAYMDSELLKWELNGQQVEYRPFKLN